MAETVHSEDTFIISALSTDYTDPKLVTDAIEEFLQKKKELDYNDRFNGIMFTKRGPQYLDNFTLNADLLIRAIRSLIPHISDNNNPADGIFVALTFIAEVFKRISGKVFRVILLTDEGTKQIPESQIPFIEDLISKTKNIPVVLDAVAINSDRPRLELQLMKLARKTGGDLYEVDQLKRKRPQTSESEEDESVIDKLGKLAKSPIKLTSRLKSSLSKKKEFEFADEEEKITDLPSVLNILAQKVDIREGLMGENDVDIPEQNKLFFEGLAEIPKVLKEKEGEKCTICFRSVKNQDMLECPSCHTHAHKICWGIWSKTSNIGIPYLMRCHNCYNLLKLDEKFVTMVHNTNTPMLEMFDMEDIVLEEYQYSIESQEKPQLISSGASVSPQLDTVEEIEFEDEEEGQEPKLSSSPKELNEQVKVKEEQEVQIIWCENCGKMITTEYKKCPQCGEPIEQSGSVVEESEIGNLTERELEEHNKIQSEINRLNILKNSQYKSQNWQKAMDYADQIINLALELEDKDRIQEEKDFIHTCQVMKKNNEIIQEVKHEFTQMKRKHESLIRAKQQDEAKRILREFQQDYQEILEMANIPEYNEFIEQEEIEQPTSADTEEGTEEKTVDANGIKQEILLSMAQEDESETDGDELISVEESDKEKAYIKSMKKQLEQIEEALQKSEELLEENSFDEAISLLKETAANITIEELSKYKQKLLRKIALIEEERTKFSEMFADIPELEKKLKEYRQEGKIYGALQLAKFLIKSGKLMEREEMVNKYQVVGKNLKIKIQEYENQLEQKEKDAKSQIEYISQVIDLELAEENTLPSVESIPISSFSDIDPNDLSSVASIISTILQQKRQERLDNLEQRFILSSFSGNGHEVSSKINMNKYREEIDEKPKGFKISQTIANPFDESVRSVMIILQLPYHIELQDIEINNQKADIITQKRLFSSALEIQYTFSNLIIDDNININYYCAYRLVRTLAYRSDDSIQLITQYSNISPSEEKGTFSVLLPFAIQDGVTLPWFVIEDVIPRQYVPYIMEPQDLSSVETSIATQGRLIAWVFGDTPSGIYLYHYKLLSETLYNTLKTKLLSLFQESVNAIENDDLIETTKKVKHLFGILETKED